MTDEFDRRRFLHRIGAVAAIGSLAGCTGGDSAGGSGDGGTTTGTETATATSTGTTTSTTATTATETGTTRGDTTGEGTTGTESATTTDSAALSSYLQPAPKTVDQFLVTNPLYDGNMVVGVPFVGVGAGEEDTGFDPAAIKVSTGTEVTWEWSSGDKAHNVVQIGQVGANERTFDSGQPQRGNNVTFRYTFEEAGIYRYVCTAHRGQSGRGAVVVEDEPVGIGGENESG